MEGEVTVGPITTIFDLRPGRPDRLPTGKSKLDARGRTVIRDPSTIDAIVLHQTAADYGEGDPRQRARSERIPYHTMVFREGWVVKSWPHLLYTYHANKANARSIGLGVEGFYPGTIGGKIWGGKRETPMTPELEAALGVALRETVTEARLLGCPIRYLLAHRQSKGSRRADPGEALWRAALPVAAELELETLPRWTVGDGKPIPKAWDENGHGRY